MESPTDLLPYLPPEMYEEIFSNLAAEEFLSVINTNPDWEDLLWDLKITMLYPLVLNVLTKEENYLSKSDLLTCRLVNSSWKSGVDSLLAREPLLYFPRRFELRNTDEMEAFMNHALSLQGRNPFLGRYAQVSLSYYPEMVLDIYGTHLETLYLHYYATTTDANDIVRRITSLLALTPNVRNLALNIRLNLQEAPLIQPLPQLPRLSQLRKLDLSFCHFSLPSGEDIEVPVLETALLQAYGGILTELKCNENLFLVNGVQKLLPRLRKLSFENSGLSALQLRILAGFNSKELEILEFCEKCQEFSPELANVLTSFPLKTLKIRIPNNMGYQHGFDSIAGLKELILLTNGWQTEVNKIASELVPFLSLSFPDLELLRVCTGRIIIERHRNSQQPLFDGLRKLKQIRYSTWGGGHKSTFTR